MQAIEAEGLKKSYGRNVALDGVDLKVRRGAIYGLLGPNGAGKTTTVRILSTLVRPDAGQARVLGFDVARDAGAVRERIALTGQFASLDEDLTGWENLLLIGRLLGLSRGQARARAEVLFDVFGLAEAAGRLVRTYSGGMRRRLDIAASLVTTPELIFLDEPTTGLDPRSRLLVWEMVRLLAGQGTTVLLTTQYLEEADRLAERIALVDRGRVIAEGTSAGLKAQVGSGALRLTFASHAERERAVPLLESLGFAPVRDADRRALSTPLEESAEAASILLRLHESGIAVVDFSFGQPSLDEVFFVLTGARSGDAPAPAPDLAP